MFYSDVINSGLILEKKEKYTKHDFNKLVKSGYTPKVARFIVMCSAVYHDTEASNFIYNFDPLKYSFNTKV